MRLERLPKKHIQRTQSSLLLRKLRRHTLLPRRLNSLLRRKLRRKLRLKLPLRLLLSLRLRLRELLSLRVTMRPGLPTCQIHISILSSKLRFTKLDSNSLPLRPERTLTQTLLTLTLTTND